MKEMKRISLIYIFCTLCFSSVVARAQDMAEPGLLATLACKLNEGRTVQEVVQWGRSNDDPAGAQQIHIRVPVSRFAGFQNLWDFQFAMYFQDYAGYANFLQAAASNNDGSLQELVTCGGFLLSDSLQVNMEAEPYTGQQTWMDTQYCMLNEGATYQDAHRWLSNIADVARNYGSNIGMQMNVRTHGNLNQGNEANRYYSIQRVGATPQDMARRLDLNRVGNVQNAVVDSGMENPNAECNNRTLWNTTVIYRRN